MTINVTARTCPVRVVSVNNISLYPHREHMFGFGKGKVTIKPEKHQYQPGETIKGVVVVNAKKQVHASQTRIALHATERRSGVNLAGGGYSQSSRTAYNYELPIDGEREFIPGQVYEFPFEIGIPKDVEQKLEGTLGVAVNALASVTGGKRTYSWELRATVDIRKSIDITGKLKIQVI